MSLTGSMVSGLGGAGESFFALSDGALSGLALAAGSAAEPESPPESEEPGLLPLAGVLAGVLPAATLTPIFCPRVLPPAALDFDGEELEALVPAGLPAGEAVGARAPAG